MTTAEHDELRELRADVSRYHDEVVKYVSRQDVVCESCLEKVCGVSLELYGAQPKNENAPGVVADVRSLKHSRTVATWSLRAIWVALVGAATTVLAKWLD